MRRFLRNLFGSKSQPQQYHLHFHDLNAEQLDATKQQLTALAPSGTLVQIFQSRTDKSLWNVIANFDTQEAKTKMFYAIGGQSAGPSYYSEAFEVQ